MTSIENGHNIYSYVRSKDGPGKECLALAVPLNEKAGLTLMLTFIDLMVKNEPKWQSKDILILFYEQSDYSFAVKEFLGTYYAGKKTSKDPFETRIQGRCGYIRQAFPLIIKDYDFAKVSLMLDGPNQQLNDIDHYDSVRKAIKTTDSLSYDTSPGYYRKNPFIQSWQSRGQAVVDLYMKSLQWVLTTFEQ